MDASREEFQEAAIVAAVDTADGAMAGLLRLLVVLREKGMLADTELKTIADSVTSKVPPGQHTGVDHLFPLLLPGYQRAPQTPR